MAKHTTLFAGLMALATLSGVVARAIWKNAKSGTQTMALSYGR